MKLLGLLAVAAVFAALGIAAWNYIPAAWSVIRYAVTVVLVWIGMIFLILPLIQGLHSPTSRDF